VTDGRLRRLLVRALRVPLRGRFARDIVLRALHAAVVAPPDPEERRGRTFAAVAAVAAGAALASAARDPQEPVLEQGRLPDVPVALPRGAVAAEVLRLAPAVTGLASPLIEERRAAAGVVERVAMGRDPAARLALAEALAGLGGPAARLPLRLLAGDADPAVRIVARRALLDGGP